jgi:hypothetical protein
MQSSYKIRFDLNNLNRTADWIVQKNIVARSIDDNPIRAVINEFIEDVEKQVAATPVMQLLDDSSKGVMYSARKQSQLCFWLEIVGLEDRNMIAPALKRMDTESSNSSQYVEKTYSSDDIAINGCTFYPHFYVRLGKEPRNIAADDL